MTGLFDDIPDAQPAQATGGLFDDLPDVSPADELGIGEEVRSVGRAAKRGLLQGMQAVDAMHLDTLSKHPPEFSDMRRAFEAGRAIETEQAYYGGRSGAVESIERWGEPAQMQTARSIAERQKRIEALPPSRDLANLKTDFWKTLAANPVETIATVVVESVPQTLPGMAVGVAGGPVGVVAGAGGNSFAVEYANSLLDSARDSGVNLSDPKQLADFFGDPAKMAAARTKGLKRGIPVAAFDAATAGLAGKFLKPALGTGVRSVATATGKELGMQMAGGMAGEAAGQLASEGKITSVPDIVLEGVAELGGAPAEVFGNIREEQTHAAGKTAVETSAKPQGLFDDLPDAKPAPEAERQAAVKPGKGMYRTRQAASEARSNVQTAVEPDEAQGGESTNEAEEEGQQKEVLTETAPVQETPAPAAEPNPEAEARKRTADDSREFDRLLVEIGPEAGWVDNLDALAPQIQGVTQDKVSISAKIARSKELQKLRYRAAQALGADPNNIGAKERAAMLPKLREFVAQSVEPNRQAKALEANIQPEDGKQPVNTGTLNVGDVLQVDGPEHPVRVTEVDPDTGDVTLEDGTRFGKNTVADGQTIYVEHVEKAPEEASGFPEPDPAAEPVLSAPESVAEQRARMEGEEAKRKAKADSEKMAELQARPLTGSHGDVGQGDMFGGGDLFSPPAPKASVTPELLKGEKINKEWTAFAPESGSLGIPRSEMPQVKSEARGALTQFLKARGIPHVQQEVLPGTLKPTQTEFSQPKVDKARKMAAELGEGDRAILVSADNHVLDGHHQWMASLTDHSEKPIRVIRFNAPVRELLTEVSDFPSAEVSKGATEAQKPGVQPTPEPSVGMGAQFRDPQRMAELKRRQEQAGFITLPDMARLVELGRKVRSALGDAGQKFSAWAAEMVRKFGNAIESLLGSVWTRMRHADMADARGVSPEAQAALNRIDELAADTTDQKPEAPPVYNPDKLETWYTRLMNQSARLLYFGGDRLLKARQKLEMRTAMQAAAVKRHSDDLARRLFEAAYSSDPKVQQWPKWLARIVPPERLRRFMRYSLPIASHLNVTGGTPGNWTFSDFDMRAGFMPEREANKQGITTGDKIWRANPVTGEVETLTLGQKMKLEDGRTGYQITRPMDAETQAQIYEQAKAEFPEFIWLLDQFVDPALADSRITINGVEIPAFNRLALGKAYKAADPSFREREAYTPDVAISGAWGSMRRYLKARKASLSGTLGQGTVSPGRKYETGDARERGFTQDLLSGFNVRAFQVLQEQERKAWRDAVLNGAEDIPKEGLPAGYVSMDSAFSQLWDAVKILHAFDDPIHFNETTMRVRDDGSPEYQKFFGELMQLRGKQLMLPEPLVKQLIGDLSIQRTDGITRQMAGWWAKNWKAGLLLMPDTFLENRTDNYLRFLMAGWRQMVAAALKGGDAQAFNEARKLSYGALVNIVPGVRYAFDLNRNRLFEAFKFQVMPDEVFAGQTRLVDLGLDQDRPLDKLKRGEIGPAILEATGYGNIDVAAKQQFAFQLLQAKAETRARAAGLKGADFEKAVESFVLNPPEEDKLRVVDAANRQLLNYADTPQWLAKFARNPIGNTLFAFPLYRYHFIGREIDRATKAFRAFYGVMVKGKRLTKAQRTAALADTISYVTLPLLGYSAAKIAGALSDSVIRGGMGGDDDDEARKLVGTSSVIETDPVTGEKTRKPLPRDLVTANRLNLSEMMRQAGVDTKGDEDLWWHYKDYPLIRSAALFYAAAEDAKKHGAAQGTRTLFRGMLDMLGSLTGTGQAIKVPAKIAAEIEGGDGGRPAFTGADPYATGVPLKAYLTMQALNLVPFNRQASEVLKWIDPTPRRITESKALDYHPGVSEALRFEGVTGLGAQLLGQRGDLPPKGAVNRRLGMVEQPDEISLAERIAAALGQNIKGVNRERYEKALDE